MKKSITLMVIACVSFSTVGICQDQNSSGSENALATVSSYLQIGGGFTEGSTEREINRLGDQAAISVLRLVPREKLRDPKMLKSVLDLFDLAFADPELIRTARDRSPMVTLFTLESLAPTIDNSALKTRTMAAIKKFKSLQK